MNTFVTVCAALALAAMAGKWIYTAIFLWRELLKWSGSRDRRISPRGVIGDRVILAPPTA